MKSTTTLGEVRKFVTKMNPFEGHIPELRERIGSDAMRIFDTEWHQKATELREGIKRSLNFRGKDEDIFRVNDPLSMRAAAKGPSDTERLTEEDAARFNAFKTFLKSYDIKID